MQIRCAIVEDDPLFQRQAKQFVSRYAQESGDDILTDVYGSSLAFLTKFNAQYDIILMDILMPGCNGFEAAERVRQFDQKCVIVFITSTPQYAIKGYAVHALSYILKPLSWPMFHSEFGRAIDAVDRDDRPTIMLQQGSSFYQVPLGSITYIESEQHRITVHTDESDIRVTTTLTELQKRLEPDGFYRINSYYIVNMDRVRTIEGQICVLDTDRRLNISRSRKKGFIEAMTRRLGQTLATGARPQGR
jgi:DNA-binding LytR/AlgR family response regulator